MDPHNSEVLCPKCNSEATLRTGAFNVESSSDGAEGRNVVVKSVVYDRRCECGHRFAEVVDVNRDVASA